METLHFEIEGEPVSWMAHGGFGRRAFNPRFKEKEYFQWKLRLAYTSHPIVDAVIVTYAFFFKTPKSFSKRKKELIKSGELPCLIRKDVTNCVKFTEDCLKGIVIDDDSQVIESVACKWYSDHPRTIITIQLWGSYGIRETLYMHDYLSPSQRPNCLGSL